LIISISIAGEISTRMTKFRCIGADLANNALAVTASATTSGLSYDFPQKSLFRRQSLNYQPSRACCLVAMINN
jgi:hypothetical protein